MLDRIIHLNVGYIDGAKIASIEQTISMRGICIILKPIEMGPTVTLTYNDGKLCAEEYDRIIREWEGEA